MGGGTVKVSHLTIAFHEKIDRGRGGGGIPVRGPQLCRTLEWSLDPWQMVNNESSMDCV